MAWLRGSLVIVLALIGLFLLLVAMKRVDPFVPVIPDTRIQSTPPPTLGSDPVELNGCWRKLLTYLQDNPAKAMPFINFVKANFFNSTCGIRQPRIHFETLADQYQPIFT
jgi:hypothetical protein